MKKPFLQTCECSGDSGGGGDSGSIFYLPSGSPLRKISKKDEELEATALAVVVLLTAIFFVIVHLYMKYR